MSLSITKPLAVTEGTHTRASTATYFDSAGLLQSAAINVLRTSYDPATLEYQGILVEDEAINLLLQSKALGNASWSKTNATVTDNVATAMDGTLTADKLVSSAVTNYIYASQTVSVTAGLKYVASVVAEAGEWEYLSIQAGGAAWDTEGANAGVRFNLLTGEIAAAYNGLTTAEAFITDYGNGRWLCEVAWDAILTTAAAGVLFLIGNTDSTTTQAGDGTSGLYLSDFQFEQNDAGRATSRIPTTTVTVTRSADVVTGMMISTVPETDYTAWSGATTYALGDRVIVVAEHKVYESLQASNTNHTPSTSATWWVEVGSTNKWKLFDTKVSTQTSVSGNMSYRLTPGQAIDAAAVLNASAESVRFRLFDPTAGLVYDQTFSLTGNIPTASWYDYFFSTVMPLDQALALDIPPYPSATLQVDFVGMDGQAACGVLLMGYQIRLGVGVRYGARSGIQDYSRKETNAWGDTVLVQRAYANRAEWPVRVLNTEIDSLARVRAAVRATPVLFVGYEGYAITSLFGFYKDFDITIAYPMESDCTLSIEGMT